MTLKQETATVSTEERVEYALAVHRAYFTSFGKLELFVSTVTKETNTSKEDAERLWYVIRCFGGWGEIW